MGKNLAAIILALKQDLWQVGMIVGRNLVQERFAGIYIQGQQTFTLLYLLSLSPDLERQ